jgi:hypothetical protein
MSEQVGVDDEPTARTAPRGARPPARRRRRDPATRNPMGEEPTKLEEDLRVQVRADIDARVPAEGLGHFLRPQAADVGLADAARARLRRHSIVRARLREAGRSWDDVPAHDRAARDPRAERKFLSASALNTSQRSSTARSTRTSNSKGSSSPTWTRRCASTRTSCVTCVGTTRQYPAKWGDLSLTH